MNGPCIRYISQQADKEYLNTHVYTNRARQTYISPYKDQKGLPPKDKVLSTSPGRFGKTQYSKERERSQSKGVPFQRSRNISIDKNQKDLKDQRSISKANEDNRREVMKFSQIKKKLQQEMLQRQKLQQLNARNELKVANLQEEIMKLRGDKKDMERSVLELQKVAEQNKNHLARANQTIEQLNKTIKEIRVNQKSLNNLKNLQNQIDFLQEKNKKLTTDNQQLVKNNNNLQKQVEKLLKETTTTASFDNYSKTPKIQSTTSLQGKFMEDIFTHKTEREKFLESNLHQLERKLYNKEKQMKKLQIQLNCYDRKKILSIDDVKTKKDKQIKDLRQRYMKVTKDLKETKDKFQKKQVKNKNLKDSAFLRKVKSSKHLGITSESEQITLELSSEP